MEYKKFNDDYVLRLDKGEEIITSIKEFAKKENITLASINGIGATDNFIVGVFDVNTKIYHSKNYKGAYEIVSLLGNITTKNNEVYLHLHMNAASEEHSIGGHLNEAFISATGEIFVHKIEGKVERIFNENSGLNLFKF